MYSFMFSVKEMMLGSYDRIVYSFVYWKSISISITAKNIILLEYLMKLKKGFAFLVWIKIELLGIVFASESFELITF